MTTVALTASPTQLDAGTTYDLVVVNSGSSAVHVQVDSGNVFDQRLSPGQSVVVYPHGLAVTAYARSGSGQVDVTTQTNPQTSPVGSFVAQAPAATGVRATDTANLQALSDAVQAAGGGRIILRRGIYLADIVTSKTSIQPIFQGQGQGLTQIDGTIKFVGTPAAVSGGGLYGLSLVGSHSSAAAVEIQGACFLTGDFAVTGTYAVGLLFHNYASGDFTEMSAFRATIGLNVARGMEYRVTSGNPSFHGSGLLDGSSINQPTSAAAPSILIGAGAQPYNCPLSVTLWALNAQPLISHLGLPSSNFYGDMKVELLPNNAYAVVCDPASTSPLPFVGSLSTVGKSVQVGALVHAERVTVERGTSVATKAGAIPTTLAGAMLVTSPAGALAYSPGGNEWVPPIRTNLCTNPSVEFNTTNWGTYYSPTAARVTSWSASGSASYQVTTTNASQTEGITYLESRSDWAQGQVMTIGFTVRSSVDLVGYAAPRIGLSGAPGINEMAAYATTVYVPANTPTRVVLSFPLPAPNSGGTITAVGWEFIPNQSFIPAAGTVYQADAVTIERATTPGSYFESQPLDGGVPLVSGNYYRAAGELVITTALGVEGQARGGLMVCGGTGTLVEIGAEITTAGSTGSLYRLMIYKVNPGASPNATLVYDAGTIDGTVTGYQGKTISLPVNLGDRLLLIGAPQGAPTTACTIRSITGDNPFFGSTSPTAVTASGLVGMVLSGVTGTPPGSLAISGAGTVPRIVVKAA